MRNVRLELPKIQMPLVVILTLFCHVWLIFAAQIQQPWLELFCIRPLVKYDPQLIQKPRTMITVKNHLLSLFTPLHLPQMAE